MAARTGVSVDALRFERMTEQKYTRRVTRGLPTAIGSSELTQSGVATAAWRALDSDPYINRTSLTAIYDPGIVRTEPSSNETQNENQLKQKIKT